MIRTVYNISMFPTMALLAMQFEMMHQLLAPLILSVQGAPPELAIRYQKENARYQKEK